MHTCILDVEILRRTALPSPHQIGTRRECPSRFDMSLSLESDGICPISLECGLTVHRRSIDVSPLDLHGVSASCRRSSSGAQPAAVLPALHRTRSGTAPAGPFSTPTPAEYLTADGRLNVSSMMESQPSNHSMRMGSFRFSRAASGRVGNDGSCKAAAAATAAAHSSAAAHAGGTCRSPRNSRSPLSSPRAADAGEEPQLSEQMQLLAAACRMRDAKSLQQILAAGTLPVSAALDCHANTALHLLLQPLWGPAAGSLQHAAGGPGADSAALCSHQQHPGSSNSNSNSSSTSSSNTGGFGWLTACFGGASSSSSHAAGSSLSRGSLGGFASQQSMSPAAAAAAQLVMVTALLAAGANVNTRNKDGLTPVMLAARQVVSACMYSSSSSLAASALKVLDTLCKSPTAEVDLRDAAGRTALVHVLLPPADTAAAAPSSSFKGSQHVTSVAVAAGASGPCCESSSVNGAAVLAAAPPAPSAAAAAALVKAVQLMVHFRADLNAQDSAGMTPLMHAAAQPGVTKELLQKMLELGANPRLLDNKRRSALAHAMMAQQLQLRPAIGAAFGKYRASSGRSAAAPAGQAAAAVPASCSSSGCIPTAPDTVINNNSSSSVPASLQGSEAASDVHNSSSSSSNASSSSRDLKAQMYYNPFPLPSHGNVIRALCSYGSIDLHPGSINTRFPAIDSYSQLHIAMRRGDLHALELLVASGADVNALDAWGNSPLMYWPVAPSEPEELVQGLVGALLAQGGDPNLPNNDGWQPLDLACELNKFGRVLVKPECVPVHALLVGYGAKNSEAFITQQRHQPALLCLRTDSANSVLRSSKSFDSLRVGNPPSLCDYPVLLPTAVMEEDP